MSLHYRIFGSLNHPVILCLHGFLGSSDDFVSLLPFLPSSFCYLLVDLPGHGASSFSEDVSFFSFAHALRQLLVTLQISSVGILAYSMGGRLALSFESLYPECVRFLILESVHPGLLLESDKQARLISDSQLARRLQNVTEPTLFLTEWYSQDLFYPLHVSSILPFRHHIDFGSVSVALERFGLGHQPHYNSFSCKTYYIYGSYDSKFKAFASHYETSFCIEGVGHLCHFMAVARFSKCVSDLLEKENIC